MSVLVVTGTGTGVGKTVTTAAVAAAASASGLDVAVCKPVQTGSGRAGEGDDDLAEISRLSDVRNLVSVARYREPLAPAAAAAADGRPLPSAAEILAAIRATDRPGMLTLVEGAGGLLVELAAGGATLRDLAVELGAPALVVCHPGLGTLNHAALTVEALERKAVSCAGLVIGSWPSNPGPVETYNRGALVRLAPVRAVLPDRAAELSPERFSAMSRAAFEPDWIKGLL